MTMNFDTLTNVTNFDIKTNLFHVNESIKFSLNQIYNFINIKMFCQKIIVMFVYEFLFNYCIFKHIKTIFEFKKKIQIYFSIKFIALTTK